ncbi:hypothetical protein T12_1148 [Trichinella patagoniensis]|uniref:Uncharacterized protein n=1 Tax=Trichinella patagoniensis TaxID=990121 RepID=A0A0V1A618_9BILA|nr:hypothetical protein T12_1148 [Trichinella patagoniensis]
MKTIKRRQALDSSATFRRQRVYYRPRSTKDYTKSYDKKIKQTERGTLYRNANAHTHTTFVFFLPYPIKAHLMFSIARQELEAFKNWKH